MVESIELLFSFENLNKNKAKKFSILTLAAQMSGDSKLKEYNTDMIMKEELKDEAFSQRQPKLIHEQTLDVQLNNLFWAFVKGDSNYIYEFDTRTYKVRDEFLKKASALGFAALTTFSITNYLYAKLVRERKNIHPAMKIGILVTINVIPGSIFAYRGYKIYADTQDYLFKKYLVN